MAKAKKEPKLIYVEWQDAVSAPKGWHTTREARHWVVKSDFIVRECGWLLRETKTYILIAGRYCPGDEFSEPFYGDLTRIPKTWIRKRRTIKTQ